MPGKLPGLSYATWDALVGGAFRDPPPVEWATYCATINCPPHRATASHRGHALEVCRSLNGGWWASVDDKIVRDGCSDCTEAQRVAESHAERMP